MPGYRTKWKYLINFDFVLFITVELYLVKYLKKCNKVARALHYFWHLSIILFNQGVSSVRLLVKNC